MLVDKLYGLEPEEKKLFREMVNHDILEQAGIVAELFPSQIPTPESEILGVEYTEEIEKYGYARQGDYFFRSAISKKIRTFVAGYLESLSPTLEQSLEEVGRLRDEVMSHLNFIVAYSRGAEPYYLAQGLNYLGAERRNEGDEALAVKLEDLGYQIGAVFVQPKERAQKRKVKLKIVKQEKGKQPF